MARTVFSNANLLDGENAARPGATVIVDNERILATHSNTSGPAQPQPNDRIVDLTGFSLMPGMVTGHFHAAYSQAGDSVVPHDASATKQALWAHGNALTALRCGYTSVVGAGTHFDIDATLADAIDSGVVQGPRFIPASRALTPSAVGEQSGEDAPFITCHGPDAFRSAALLEIQRGAKVIKLFAASGHALLGTREMTADELRAVVETAKAHGVRTRAHVGGRDQVLQCVRLGVDIIDHADGMDDECIEAFLEHGCFVLPSLHMPYLTSLDNNAPLAELFNPKDFEQMLGVVPKAAAAGVKFVPGDDYGIGVLPHGSYSGELACYVEQVGLSPLEVIKWATRNGGELMGIADLGTVAPGKLADLVVVDGDPSDDINILRDPERIVAVIKGGEVVCGELPVARAVTA
jgi:imidazolonepropionase-like amidohydrolase